MCVLNNLQALFSAMFFEKDGNLPNDIILKAQFFLYLITSKYDLNVYARYRMWN